MGVEIVIHKNDLLGQRVMHVDQFAHDLGIIFGGAPFANADMALAFQRYKEHEHVGLLTRRTAQQLVVDPFLLVSARECRSY